jgi:outer membrane protein assembly factor BamB
VVSLLLAVAAPPLLAEPARQEPGRQEPARQEPARQEPARPEPRPGIDWPQFRGIRAAGVAEGHPLPRQWDVSTGAGVAWKTPVPGLAHSSPVVWGPHVFLTTAVSAAGDPELKVGLYGDVRSAGDTGSQRFEVLCLDKTSGEVRWRSTAYEGEPKTKRHPKATHANPTPATDGRRVVTFFGSEGLYCHDADGRLSWKKDFGVLDSGFFMAPDAQWGFASSPVIHDGRVLVQVDVQKGGFLAALDLETGEEVWRVARADVPTWSTPTVWPAPEQAGAPRGDGGGATAGVAPAAGASTAQALVLANGFRHMGAYDFATGREVWRMSGGGDIPVPTPIVAHGLAFITNAHGRMAPVYAVRPDARGDITLQADATSNAGIAWSVPRDGGYMQTPIVYGDLLYVAKDNGVLTCFDARTGEEKYKTRIGDGSTGFTSSPVAGDGKIYFTSEQGDVVVVRAGPEYHELARNELGEIHMATPAISEGVLYFRTKGHLIAIGGPAAAR